MNVLSQIAAFENLVQAFYLCARGKKKSKGYQEFFFGVFGHLKIIEEQLLADRYCWGGYKEFVVHDPKKRTILSAPFRDRVVHQAITQIIGPYLEKKLAPNVYACRIGKGNKYAALDLKACLKKYGENRYVVKLDVQKYFQNISHPILLEMIGQQLPDAEVLPLLKSLLQSHYLHQQNQRGIPIGNLTSQLFANFYLFPLDDFILTKLVDLNGDYFRYMDDLVIILPSKKQVHHLIAEIVVFAQQTLSLVLPSQKIVHLHNQPVPFLGFLLDEHGYDILARNKRRAIKKIKRLTNARASASRIEQSWQSLSSWMDLNMLESRHKSVKVERPDFFRGRRASWWQLEQWYQRRCLYAQSEQCCDEHEHEHWRPLPVAACQTWSQ